MGAAIFPTTRLYEYYNNGFQTLEQKQAEKSIAEAKIANKRVKIANWIAGVSVLASMVIGAASPFVSVHYGNEHGYTELKKVQYDSIMSTLKDNAVKLQQYELPKTLPSDTTAKSSAAQPKNPPIRK